MPAVTTAAQVDTDRGPCLTFLLVHSIHPVQEVHAFAGQYGEGRVAVPSSHRCGKNFRALAHIGDAPMTRTDAVQREHSCVTVMVVPRLSFPSPVPGQVNALFLLAGDHLPSNCRRSLIRPINTPLLFIRFSSSRCR